MAATLSRKARLRTADTPINRAAAGIRPHAIEADAPPLEPDECYFAPRRDRSRVAISISEGRRIRNRLTGVLNGQASPCGFVCSEPWARVCLKALESGRVPMRRKLSGLEADLHKRGVYPPGSAGTSMVENTRTLRWMPPDYSGEALDDREDCLSLVEGCRLPRSASALAIEKIRYYKSRPEKNRIRTSKTSE